MGSCWTNPLYVSYRNGVGRILLTTGIWVWWKKSRHNLEKSAWRYMSINHLTTVSRMTMWMFCEKLKKQNRCCTSFKTFARSLNCLESKNRCFVIPAQFKVGVVWGRDREHSPLPRARYVRQRCWATTRRQLLGSGHSTASGHPSFLCTFPVKASIRCLQWAAAHVPMLHERPLFGGRRLATGRSTRVLWPQAPPHKELTNTFLLLN